MENPRTQRTVREAGGERGKCKACEEKGEVNSTHKGTLVPGNGLAGAS